MKKTRIAKMLTAAALSAAMVMTMGGMTAFAAEPVDVKFDKVLKIGANDSIPDVSFEFGITKGNAQNATETTREIKEGIFTEKDGKIYPYIAPVTFAVSDTKDKDEKTQQTLNQVTHDVTVDFSEVEFTAPGVYRYVITEVDKATANDGLDIYDDIALETGSTGTRYLDVLVSKQGNDFVVSKFQLLKSESALGLTGYGETVKSEGFVNVYTTNTLTLTKHVTGDMGDTGVFFPFAIELEGPANATFKMTIGDNAMVGATTETTVDVTLNAEGKATFDNANRNEVNLKDNGTITIAGIPSYVKYTITEVDQASAGYATKNEINSNTTEWSQVTVDKKDHDYTTEEQVVGNTKKDNMVKVDFVNYRTTDDIPMTGIILNFAPYALLVAFAGVFAVLFLRKRREEF